MGSVLNFLVKMTIGDLTHVSCHPSGSELVKPLAPAGLGVAGRASLTWSSELDSGRA